MLFLLITFYKLRVTTRKLVAMKKIILIALMAGFSLTYAQTPKKWNVSDPGGPSYKVNYTVDEGTWMSIDVSPDGKELVFDLLGDIYTLPITGGKAKLLRGGLPYEVQPRYSPDGKYISFTSDREGGDNIFIMNRDGSNVKQITKESFRLLNNATWTPDGQYIIARKHFTFSRSLGAGEMWMYHIGGGTDGLQLTKRKNEQQDAGEPAVSPDGKYVYWSEDVSPGPFFQYNKDPNGQIYAIYRINRQSGNIEQVTGGPGGAVRPVPSPDGKYLAFVRRDRLKSVLYLKDLQTSEEFPVYDELSKDQQEAWAIFGLYPNFAWTPDSKNIVFWAKGKIMKLDIATFATNIIPFEAVMEHTIADVVKFDQKVHSNEFEAKMIRHTTTSSDGKRIAFNAAGYIYLKELPNGTPQRMSNSANFEYEPHFSADGNSILYVSYDDQEKCSINRIDLKTKRITTISKEKGFYYSPTFSRDGRQIVYRKGTGNDALGYFGTNPGIYIMNADGTNSRLVSERGLRPMFDGTGTKLYYQSTQQGRKAFISLDLSTNKETILFTSQYANWFVPSPDGKWVAFNELFNCYIAPMPLAGNAVDLSGSMRSVPLRKVTRDAGTYMHWSADSKNLHWTLGPEYFTQEIKNAFTFVEGAPETLPAIDSTGIKIGLVLKSDVPNGKTLLQGARIISMNGDEVIENGSILIEGNKIIAIGAANSISVPSGTNVIDVSGKTIMPGIIDVHAHLRPSFDGISPKQDWSYFANLAYGVTAAHDPSTSTEMVFSQAEMVKAGRMLGPRIYSTGTILYGADGDFKAVINSLEDARSHLRRLKNVGAFSVKSYNQPRREQRQQVIQAARELEMLVMPEGGSTFFHNMNMILDGHTGVEHNIPIYPAYADVKKMWNSTKTGYTPTLVVNYGSMSGEYYWYQHMNVWEEKPLTTFTPRSVYDPRSRRRQMAAEADYGHIESAKLATELERGGTKVNLGAHGQLQGLGAHWELWMMAQGGMTPLEAIRVATLNGANYIGMDKEIGSLEVGKLADLIVLNENPLENIRNTKEIKYVMINGRLFDALTMNEIGGRGYKAAPFYWTTGKNAGRFSIGDETEIFTVPNCD